MNTMTRIRHGGLLVLSTLAAVALSACKDGFFFEPASTALTPIVVQYAWTNTTEGVALAGAPEAFDKADGAQVSLTTQDKVLFEGRVALEPSGSDKKLTFQVDMPAGQSVSAQLQVTLVQGQTPLFQGAAAASLTPGKPAEVTLPLNGVVNTLALNTNATTLRTIGGTFKLVTTGIFASGDTLGPVAATYQALGGAVSVASDGTVTAVSNGSADVRASYLGKTATVTITVEDRCQAPFASIAVGQTVNGTLATNDCEDVPNFAYNDWYQMVIGAGALVRATLTGNGVDPFVGINATDKQVLGVAASQDGVVTSEYAFPAGTYLLRAGSRARTAGPIPTGSYVLSLTSASEPQTGCFATATSSLGATWVVDGVALQGRLAADDCAPGPNVPMRQDVYGGRLLQGDTALVTVDASFPIRLLCGADERRLPDSGGRMSCAFTSDADQSHYIALRTAAAGPFGAYDVRFDGELPLDFSACNSPPLVLPLGGIASPISRSGRLQRRIDCETSRVNDFYDLVAPPEPLKITLASADFDPFIAVAPLGRTGFGRSSASGSISAEYVLPPGHRYEIRALAAPILADGGRVEGNYTLTTERLTLPQEGCISTSFVDFGSSAQGRITPEDCEDEFDNEPAVVRWWDGYSILLQPGETVTVTSIAAFPSHLTHWANGEFVEGLFVSEAGVPATLTVTNAGPDRLFHAFYVISGGHQDQGSYQISFSGTPLPPAAAAGVAGHGARRTEVPYSGR